jgi:hypothetical protein
MVSFTDMKKNREKMFQELNKQISDKGGKFKKDDRFWYPSVDQAGNGFAIIRFLPAPGDEPVPFVDIWSYGFKDRNGWYIENSRTTLGIGEADPVHESNKALRADGTKASKAIADRRKASQSYFSNILVVRDQANPENEGKVFLFRYGRKIMNKIEAKMSPEFEGEEKMNPFDLWEGANLRLKIKTEGKTAENPKGFRNYDNSEWDSPGPLYDDDKKMEKVWKSSYSLQDLIAPDKFKTYEELKARFELVTGERKNSEERAPTQSRSAPEEETVSTADRFRERRNEQPAAWEEPEPVDNPPAPDQDDADLEYYQNLLNGNN